ncbi:MAG: HEAT repeat domain-containing protein [Cytophagales bacterium]|nr:HEAT repeat domain-containing protein [Cytophagales bacterium]
METNITDEQLIELLEGKKNLTLTKQMEENPAAQKRYFELKEIIDTIANSSEVEVPEHIRANVQQAIYDEQANLQNGFSWMHIAAAAIILILGFSMGKFTNKAVDSSAELAELKTEVQSLKEATLASSLKRHSASDRIHAVSQIESASEASPELLATLVNTLNSDDSPNVRYAALQALTNYIDIDEVKYELVKSLEEQTDPLIQISLIVILVEAQVKSATVPMRNLIEAEETLPQVKEQAEIALKVLV